MKVTLMIPPAKLSITLVMLLGAWPPASAAPTPVYPHPAATAVSVAANANLHWSNIPRELIRNGDFEAATLTNWTTTPVAAFATDDGTLDTGFNQPSVAPFSGNRSGVFLTTGPFNFQMFQEFTIPAGARKVTATWADHYNDLGGMFGTGQRYRVQIRSTGNSPLATLFETLPGHPAASPWTRREADVSEFAGQTIRLAFVMDINNAPLTVHWDNVSVLVEETDPVTHDVYFGTGGILGPADLQGATTNTTWELPQLLPNTTYFWRVVARLDASSASSPVWSFTTGPVGPVDHFEWTEISPLDGAGGAFMVRLTAQDALNNTVTNFNEPVAFTANPLADGSAHSILRPSGPTALAAFQAATVGYSFTPSSDIAITHVRHLSGEKVSIWTEAGVLLASQPVVSTPGIWRETALDSPLTLEAHRSYRIGVYTAKLANHFTRFDAPAQFDHGAIHQSYEGNGDGFPSMPHDARWWLVDLRYIAGSGEPSPLQATSTPGFVDGVWSGRVTAPAPPLTLFLAAQSSSGPRGVSSPLALASTTLDSDGDGLPNDWELLHGLNPNDPTDAETDRDGDGASNGDEFASGTDPNDVNSVLRAGIAISGDDVVITLATIEDRSYRVEKTGYELNGTWTAVADNLAGTGATIDVTDPDAATQPGALYRILLLTP